LEKGIGRWRQLSEDQRKAALAGFDGYFRLTPEEKEKTLDTLSDDERKAMEKTLSTYANLTLAQRAQCIRSFEKFAGLTITERQQFLKNAEHWHAMKPEERQKWRELVDVAPIMPPMTFPSSRPLPSRSLMINNHPIATN
jgi:hypothetical protein